MVISLDSDSRGPGFESWLLHISFANLRIYITTSRNLPEIEISRFDAFLRAIFRVFQYRYIDRNLRFIVDIISMSEFRYIIYF